MSAATITAAEAMTPAERAVHAVNNALQIVRTLHELEDAQDLMLARGSLQQLLADVPAVIADLAKDDREARAAAHFAVTPAGRDALEDESDDTPACNGDPRCKTHRGGTFDVFGERECRR